MLKRPWLLFQPKKIYFFSSYFLFFSFISRWDSSFVSMLLFFFVCCVSNYKRPWLGWWQIYGSNTREVSFFFSPLKKILSRRVSTKLPMPFFLLLFFFSSLKKGSIGILIGSFRPLEINVGLQRQRDSRGKMHFLLMGSKSALTRSGENF